MKLKTTFSLAISSLVGVIFLVGGISYLVSERHHLQSEMRDRHDQMVKRLAQVSAESLHQNDLALLNYIKTLDDERGLEEAFFLDAKGSIHVHSTPSKAGQRYTSPREAEVKQTSDVFRQQYTRVDGSPVLDVAFPIWFSGTRVGSARLVFNEDVLTQYLNQTLKESLRRIGLIMAVALGVGILGAFLLAQALTRPIQDIVKGMRQMAAGKLDPIRFRPRKDELGWMGTELNHTIDKLKALDEMKRDFVSGVTHELRSPLLAIDSYANMTLNESKEALPASQRNFILTIQNNTKRLMGLVDNLLTTARIESGRQDFSMARFDVVEVIQSVVRLYAAYGQKKGISLKTKIPAGTFFVWGDSEKTIHVLNNLISNALKFTLKGSVTVALEKNGDQAVISVSDTGMGIPSTEKDRIFDKFYRVKRQGPKIKGTGLGLAIAKGLVEGQEGRMGVTDNPGGGSRFWFSLLIN